MKTISGWIDHLLGKYTYSGKIKFVCIMVLSLCAFLIFEVTFFQYEMCSLYQSKLIGIQNHRVLSALLQSSTTLRVTLNGNENKSKEDKEIIAQLVADIDTSLRDVQTFIYDESTNIAANKKKQNNLLLDKMLRLWHRMRESIVRGESVFNKSLDTFDRNILDLMNVNIERHRLEQGGDIVIYLLSNVSLNSLPYTQYLLSSIANQTPNTSTVPEVEMEIETSSLHYNDLLRTKIQTMETEISNAIYQQNNVINGIKADELMEVFLPYRNSVLGYLQTEPKSKHSRELLDEALNLGWESEVFWINYLENALKKALRFVRMRQLGTLVISIFGLLIFLAMYITRVVRRPLEELKFAAKALAEGDLSVRIPIRSHDEVTKIIIAFNELAALWEQSVHKAKNVANRLVNVSSDVFDIATNLETNIVNQEATIESMKAQAKRIAVTTYALQSVLREVKKSISKTSSLVEQGKYSLTEMEEISKQMGLAGKLIVDTLSMVRGQVDRIKGVLNVSVSIADQSNILSLNTAIRANQTGTSGAGFAVVAGKISELAEQIAFATLDIEEAVHEIVRDVSTAILGVEEFSFQILEQVQDEKSIHEQFTIRMNQTQRQLLTFDKIYIDMKQQFEESSQIDEMINQLAKVSIETGISARKLHHDAELLNRGTQNLQEMIARFRFEGA